jgi:hypothetical protein
MDIGVPGPLLKAFVKVVPSLKKLSRLGVLVLWPMKFTASARIASRTIRIKLGFLELDLASGEEFDLVVVKNKMLMP